MHSIIKKKIWIDLDNSPHVPFFKPIIEELRKKNYTFTITARECFQVSGLTDLMEIDCTPIGKHYGKHISMKIIGSLFRVFQLLPMIIRERPDIAVSHGSRPQQVIGKILGIPTILIGDYEHATSMLMPSPACVIVPAIISSESIGYKKSPIYKYDGIKEDVYVPTFKPNPRILGILGLSENDTIVVVRPPASEAHYRNPESEKLFSATIQKLAGLEHVKIVMLPRNEKQEKQIKAEWPELFSRQKIIIPEKVVEGLNLIWHSDLIISGGGTMNREAAALGVPVYSIFRGKTGAVDKYLTENGRLIMLESIEDVKSKLKVIRRDKADNANFPERPALKTIVSIIEKVTKENQ